MNKYQANQINDLSNSSNGVHALMRAWRFGCQAVYSWYLTAKHSRDMSKLNSRILHDIGVTDFQPPASHWQTPHQASLEMKLLRSI